MKLVPVATQHEYEFRDGTTGYSYCVRAVLDPEWGWNADVTMRSHGFATDVDAVAHLKHAAEHFLRALANVDKGVTK